MNIENHKRAKELLLAARVEGISVRERQWLNAHLADCSECSNEANALAFAIDSLRSLSVSVDPEVVRRASLAVHQRSQQLRNGRERALPLWIAATASSACAVVTIPYVWTIFAWLGRMLHLSEAVWQLGFLMWWFLPATALSVVLARQQIARRNAASHWVVEIDWR